MDNDSIDFKSKEYDELFVLANASEHNSEKLAIEPYSYWSSVFRVFRKKKSATFAVSLLIVLILGSIFIPILSPFDTNTALLVEGRQFHRPCFRSGHWFGGDELGRDLLVTTFSALRFSLFLALTISLINAIVGVVIGTIWGFFRKIDPIMIEITNLLTNIPNLLIWILVIFILTNMGVPNTAAFIVTLTIIGWLPMARLVRNQILIISDREYNLASKTLGTSNTKMIINNILPFILPVIITSISLTIPATVAAETSLAFFGLGLLTDEVALGPMLTLGFNNWISFPWILIAPAGILAALTVAFYLLGLALSDSLDPKLHR